MNGYGLGFVLAEAGSLVLFKRLLSLGLHPYFLVMVVSLAAAGFIGGYYLLNQKPFKHEVKKIVSIKMSLPSALAVVAGNLIGLLGLKLTSATNYSFLTRLSVLVTPILAFIVLKERINQKIWPLIGVAVVGIWLLTAGQKISLATWGDGLALVATLTISLDFIFQKRAVKKVPPGVVAFWRRLLQALMMVAVWLLTPRLGRVGLADLSLIAWLVLGFVAMSMFMIKALDTGPVAEFNLIINLSPVLVALLAFWFLGEKLSQPQFIGVGLILTAISLFSLLKKQESFKLQTSV